MSAPKRGRFCSPTDGETIPPNFDDIRIFVKTLTGQTITLDVSQTDSEADIKIKLLSMGYGFDVGYKLCVQLEEGHNLWENPIANNATFLLVKTAYRIWVKPKRGVRFALDVEASDTICNLKTMIQEATVSRNGSRMGVPRELQHLFCNSVQLVTGALSDNNIQAEAIIFCTWDDSELRLLRESAVASPKRMPTRRCQQPVG